MKTYASCVQCLVKNTIRISEMLARNEAEKEKIIKQMLHEIAEFDSNAPPPFMARRIYSYAAEETETKDPYQNQKDASAIIAKKLLQKFLAEEKLTPDHFESLVRLAIAGNIIDFGANCDLDLNVAKETIEAAFSKPIDGIALKKAENAMDSAKNILYLLDNCGEAVFDSMLVKKYRDKITLSVKGAPILNDITRRELKESGFDGIPKKIVDTGDCTPGLDLNRSSEEFLEAYRSADLVISKGQGNYECLNMADKPIVFLFMAKCQIVAELLNAEKDSFQIICHGF